MPASKHRQRISKERREEIGRRLYEAREDLGITQVELAGRISVYPTTISRYETGDAIPIDRILIRLAEALDKPIPYLRASDWNNNEGGADGTG